MKVYGDLVIKGDPQALKNFIAALDQHLGNGWSRYHEREAEVRKAAVGPMYCFRCTEQASRPASSLWLASHSNGSLYVSNILADSFPSLTYDQYNTVLADFAHNCAAPAALVAGVRVELGKTNPQLEDFMSSEAAKLLRSFSALSNRSFLNPGDRRRWNEFLASAYREDATLSSDTLQRWLIEDEKWPEDVAMDLAIEFERAKDLLETFEAQHA